MQAVRSATLLAPMVALILALAGCHPAGEIARSVPADADPTPPAPPPIAREFRGAWVSPVENGEWPSRPGMPVAEQKAELLGLLDRAQAIGLNAVVLHVRPAADALYPTDKAPWSAYLTGELGRAPEPAWDPLAFAVEEAHARGLELHAWFNPFRAAPPDRRITPVAGHVAVDHPDWVVRYGSQLWVDPGRPEARAWVLEAIMEVVDRYDVDGIHLDDYFYPYREERTVREKVGRGRRARTVTRTETIPFPDDATWARYGVAAGFEKRSDWRRSNIDGFVRELYADVKSHKPWVSVGISPFGIWRSGYPAGVTGLDAYGEIYADARRWLREGWVDYMSPQLYWTLDGSQGRFLRLDEWWRGENLQGRHIWPGLHTDRIHSGWTAVEIARQIDTLRAVRAGTPEGEGHIHFRLKAMRSDAPGSVADLLRAGEYAETALPPAMPWLGRSVPAPPRLVLEEPARPAAGPRLPPTEPRLDLLPGNDVPVRWWAVQRLGEDGRWSTRIRPAGTTAIATREEAGTRTRAIAVRAISPTGVESAPSVVSVDAR